MAKFGYPLVVGIRSRELATSLAGSCLEARTHTSGTLGQTVSASRLIPRLSSLEVRDGDLTAVFEVSSGSLSIGGTSVRRYEVSGPLAARRAGQKLFLESDPKGSFVCSSGSVRATLDAAEARKLGLVAASAFVDGSPWQIGDWKLQLRGTPGFRGEGATCFIGTDVDPRRNGVSFAFSPSLTVEPSDLRSLPTTLAASGFGVLVDEDLVPLLIDTIERRLNGRSDFRRVRVVPGSMDGHADFQVTGSGQIFRLGGWKDFTFSARARLQLANDRIEVAYEVTDAWHGGLYVLPLMGEGDKKDEFDAQFPRRWGTDDLPLGRHEITSLGGQGEVIELRGTALPVAWDPPEHDLHPRPGRTLFLHGGQSRSLDLRNLPAAAKKRRATLRQIEARVEKLPAGRSASDFTLRPTESAVAAGNSDRFEIEYSGTGETKGELVIPTNDGELRYPLEAAETEGSLGLIAIVHIRGQATRTRSGQWLVPDGFARFWITHQGGSSVRYSVATGGRFSVSPTGMGEVSRVRPSEARTVRFHGGGAQLTRNPQTGRLELRTTGEVKVTTTAGTEYVVKVDVWIEEGPSIAGDPWWKEYFMSNSREIRALLPQLDSGWLRKHLVDLGTPSFEEPSLWPPPRPCGLAHADWQTWRFPADVEARWTRGGSDAAEIRPEAGVCVVPTRGNGRLEVHDGTESLRIRVARFGEILLAREEVGEIHGLAWSGGALHVATAGELRRYRVLAHGALLPIDESPGPVTALLGMEHQLLVARGLVLETHLAPADGESRVTGEWSFGHETRAQAALADGRVAMAGEGLLSFVDPATGETGATVDDPAHGRSLLATGSWLLSCGDGVCLFTAEGIPERVEHWHVGEVRAALVLDGVALLASEEGVYTLDLESESPRIASRVDWSEVPEDSLVRNRAWAVSRNHLVASATDDGVLEIHSWVRFAVEPEAASRLDATGLDLPSGP